MLRLLYPLYLLPLPALPLHALPLFAACLEDQDQMLGSSFPTIDGQTPLGKTQKLLADLGTTAENFFIHTPICCPSRSELLSGRYFHNIKTTKGGCMHVNESKVLVSVSIVPVVRPD